METGLQRAELMNAIYNENDPYKLKEAFHGMTELEKAFGKLKGKLMQCKGYDQVDKAIVWFETEYAHLLDGPLDYFKKNMILTETVLELAGATDHGYRTIRKVLVTLNQGA